MMTRLCDSKSIVCLVIFSFLAVTMAAGSAFAGKPVDDQGVPFGNGFPSGPHYNLNINAKQSFFSCPAPEFDPETGEQIFGNVIFIPRDQGNDDITILMESDTKGPKNAPGITELQVIDWCTESFADDGGNNGDMAVLQLPENKNGYAVYARITGKPGDDGGPSFSMSPDLFYVEDETGNDLLLLGLVDPDGVSKFTSDGETITRYSTSTSGKGAKKATNITDLFQWTGSVCYLSPDNITEYCMDENGEYICSPYEICCVDTDLDGIYDSCGPLADVGIDPDGDGNYECPEGSDSVTAECRQYDNEWIFNISDFVGYLWNIDTDGAYHIQVRFYPL